MGDSVLEQITKIKVDELLDNPEWAQVLTKTVRDVNKHVYPQIYLDVIGQKWREKFDLYDAYAFNLIHLAIMSGKIAIFQIPVSSEPFPDKEIEKNNEVLKKLEYPFSGKFFGGTQGEDGYIRWEVPINALVNTGKQISFVIVSHNDDQRFVCPLEVGYIPFEKTLDYLKSAWVGVGRIPGLARWPYGQNKITVLVNYGIFTTDDDGFESLLEKVHGNFQTLPNPWESWFNV